MPWTAPGVARRRRWRARGRGTGRERPEGARAAGAPPATEVPRNAVTVSERFSRDTATRSSRWRPSPDSADLGDAPGSQVAAPSCPTADHAAGGERVQEPRYLGDALAVDREDTDGGRHGTQPATAAVALSSTRGASRETGRTRPEPPSPGASRRAASRYLT